jgi:MOSC domain-containing protein YiiM
LTSNSPSPFVLQVNVSRGGIPKRAVSEAEITLEGLRGDWWAHPNIHGGSRQAVLLVTVEGIEELIAKGFELYPGALGENLTTRGLDRLEVRAAQRYRVGTAVLHITKLRAPCATLNVFGPGLQAVMFDAEVQAGNPASPRWGLSGFYASVVQPGTVRTGDSIVRIE